LIGDDEQNVPKGINFEELPSSYHCPLCAAAKEDFAEVDEASLKNGEIYF
jgi:rubredoxin